MKTDNRYSRAIRQISPDENFVSDTVQKLTQDKPRKNYTRYALSAAAALVILVLAVGVFPKMLRTKEPAFSQTADPAEAQPTAQDTAGTQTAANTVTRQTAAEPTSLPAPEPEAPGEDPYYEADMFFEDSYVAAGGATYEVLSEYEIPYWASQTSFGSASWNTEEYAHISESGFHSTLLSPLSTFAADVDTAGYTTVRRKLLGGELPSGSAVRIEEMLNYFHYDGLAPEDSTAIKISASLGACPWNEEAALLFVGIGAQQIRTDDLPASNLVFLIDTSGSMDGSDRLDLAKRAFHLLADTLRAGDRVSVVTYSGSFNVLLEGADAADRAKILDVIDSLEAWGSTNGGDALVTAYNIAAKYFIDGGNNRVIMMTDGDLNVGITSESELVSLVEGKKESGVFLSVLGFGMGNYKDSKLEALADHGNGVYSYIDSITEARRTLVTEMGANFFNVARDVKLQAEFNPAYVSAYRLIGYENRALANEDFADDSKDGGEMGAGHTVVALYELLPAEGVTLAGVTGKAAETKASSLRYQASLSTEIAEVVQISVRYQQPEGSESSLLTFAVRPEDLATGSQARNLTKAAAVAEFGMLLRDSEYKGSTTYDSAFRLLSGLEDLREEESELMYLISVARDLSEGTDP